jgi:hypothetical protein
LTFQRSRNIKWPMEWGIVIRLTTKQNLLGRLVP